METTTLFRLELSTRNILVCKSKLSAVLDWECTSIVPGWASHTIHGFLYGQLRPYFDGKDYVVADDGNPYARLERCMLEHEETLWRHVSIEEMKKLQLGWKATYEQSWSLVEFDLAILSCEHTSLDEARC